MIMDYHFTTLYFVISILAMSPISRFSFRGLTVAFSGGSKRHGHILSIRLASAGLNTRALVAHPPSAIWYSNMSNDDENEKSASDPDDDDPGHTRSFVSHDHSLTNGRLKFRLRNGLALTGVVTGQYRDTDHVEMLGLLGFDFLWADCEHSSGSPDHVLSLILAAERRGMPTLVRIGSGYQNVIG